MGLDAGGIVQTSIDLAFADGEYTFRLGLAQIKLLQDKCGCGIGALYARVLRGRYLVDNVNVGITGEADFRIEDLHETIRQGLIGGGAGLVDGEVVAVTSIKASALVEGYVIGRPLKESWNLAAAVLMALVEGYEPPKKVEPGTDPATETADTSTTHEPSPTAP